MPTRDDDRQIPAQEAIQPQQQEVKKNKGTVWKVLLWIFFLPVMAIIAIWKAQRLPKVWKIVLTTVIAFVCLLYYIGDSQNRKTAETASVMGEKVIESSAPTATLEPTPEPTEAPTASPEAIGESEQWEANDDAVAALTETLEKSFSGRYQLTVDQEMQAYSVSVRYDGMVKIATAAKYGNADAQKAWQETKESITLASAVMKTMIEDAGDERGHILYMLQNDENAELILLSMYDGLVMYDATTAQ